MREMDVVLKEIIKRTKGDITKLQKIFGEESIRAINPMAKSFQKFGDFREFDAFVEKGGGGATIMKDFAFWSEQTAAKLRNLRTQGSKFANENLADPIVLLNKALDTLNNNPALAKGGLYGLLGLAGLGAGVKISRGIGGVFGSIGRILGLGGRGGKGARGLAGGLLGGKGPVPVYVVNKGALGLGGKGGGAGKIRGLLKKAPLAAGGKLALAGAAGYGVGTLLNTGAGWLSGKLTGGEHKGSGWLGSMLYDLIHGKPGNVKNDIKLNVRIDRDGRVYSETNSMGTKVDTKLDRGTF